MPSSNIYLGSNQILEAQGSRRMYLGGQLICKAYFGSTLVFDNCAVANSNVELQLDTSGLSAPSAGYTIGGNLSGFTKSGQPTTSYTAFSTTATVNSGYSGSITVSNAPGGTFPTPGGTTTIVTTTITGSVTSNLPSTTAQLNLTNNIQGWIEGDSGTVTKSPNNGADQTRVAGQQYSFTVSVSALNSGWQLDSAITGAGTYTGTHPSSPSTFPVNVTLGGQVSLINYTLTPGTITYNVTNGTVGNQFTAGSWTTGAQSGTKNDSYSFALSGLAADTANGYSWQGGTGAYGATITYSITPSGNFSQTATINATVTGQINQSLSAITLYNHPTNASCANDACINKGTGTTAYYYAGSLNSATLTDTWGNNPTTGFHAISGGGVLNYSPGSSSTVSCYSQLYYTAVATGGGYGNCNNPLTDYWYLNTTSFPTLAYVDGNSDGCSPATNLTINNGNDWVTTDSTGYVTSRGSC